MPSLVHFQLFISWSFDQIQSSRYNPCGTSPMPWQNGIDLNVFCICSSCTCLHLTTGLYSCLHIFHDAHISLQGTRWNPNILWTSCLEGLLVREWNVNGEWFKAICHLKNRGCFADSVHGTAQVQRGCAPNILFSDKLGFEPDKGRGQQEADPSRWDNAFLLCHCHLLQKWLRCKTSLLPREVPEHSHVGPRVFIPFDGT